MALLLLLTMERAVPPSQENNLIQKSKYNVGSMNKLVQSPRSSKLRSI